MFHTFQRFSLEKQLFISFVGFAAVLLLFDHGCEPGSGHQPAVSVH